MLSQLQPFRDALDDIMWKAMHDRVLLYGYDTYTGRFLKWYAEYYHGITVDWLVSEDMSTGRGYDREIFRPSVLDFGYKDVRNAIVWVAQPMTDDLRARLEARGYVEGETYFDFYKAIYGDDVSSENHNDRYDAFHQRKAGKRDIQFIEWLEWKYDCNFIMPIAKDNFENVDEHGARYSISTQKEIFPMLDKCHVCLRGGDRILDFGCGKGGALLSFLDYGFDHVGGVEYEKKTYDVAQENVGKLGLQDRITLINDDARNVKEQLDDYNWFYFFFPFDKVVFETVIGNIKDSYLRKHRKIRLIYFTAMDYGFIEDTGVFRLTTQFTVDSRQRVVGIFESV